MAACPGQPTMINARSSTQEVVGHLKAGLSRMLRSITFPVLPLSPVLFSCSVLFLSLPKGSPHLRLPISSPSLVPLVHILLRLILSTLTLRAGRSHFVHMIMFLSFQPKGRTIADSHLIISLSSPKDRAILKSNVLLGRFSSFPLLQAVQTPILAHLALEPFRLFP